MFGKGGSFWAALVHSSILCMVKRVPVYYEQPTNMIGLILVKNLLDLHPADEIDGPRIVNIVGEDMEDSQSSAFETGLRQRESLS
ncbi:hypothetical protein H6P81_019476 [Aristolochia fimbriata]|uniref:Uncharacterized protein n=1 Tax=Aristolochia fimbriata TaxID=158543 RepID=A0AAV7DSY5_ARIFI|nr:hypothetical protein H6P81_019476 [Aristolochia fimbriata]